MACPLRQLHAAQDCQRAGGLRETRRGRGQAGTGATPDDNKRDYASHTEPECYWISQFVQRSKLTAQKRCIYLATRNERVSIEAEEKSALLDKPQLIVMPSLDILG